MKVCIIIPTFNSWQVTAETVKKLLYEQTYKGFDIIIVDAGSKDYEKLKEIFKDEKRVIILHTEKDLGGAGSFWLGMKYAYEKGYDIFILSDNDAIPLSNNLIEKLIKIARDKKMAVFPYNIAEDIWDIYPKHAPFHFLVIPRYIIKSVGFPNPYFFIWGDDTEYTQRISKLRRLLHIKDPNMSYYHPLSWYGFSTFLKERAFYNIRNQLIRLLKHDKLKFPLILFLWLNISFMFAIIFKNSLIIKRFLFSILDIFVLNLKFRQKIKINLIPVAKSLENINIKSKCFPVIKKRAGLKIVKILPKIIGKIVILDKNILAAIFLPVLKGIIILDGDIYKHRKALYIKVNIIKRIVIFVLLFLLVPFYICLLFITENPITLFAFEKRIKRRYAHVKFVVIKNRN